MEEKYKIIVDSSINLLPEFPYLSDKQIRDLDYTDFQIVLQSVNATQSETTHLKRERKRMRKSNWKYNHDKLMRIEHRKLEQVVTKLKREKSELIQLRQTMIAEIHQYELLMHQMNGEDASAAVLQ